MAGIDTAILWSSGDWLSARLQGAGPGLRKATGILLKARASVLPQPGRQGVSLSNAWVIDWLPELIQGLPEPLQLPPADTDMLAKLGTFHSPFVTWSPDAGFPRGSLGSQMDTPHSLSIITCFWLLVQVTPLWIIPLLTRR